MTMQEIADRLERMAAPDSLHESERQRAESVQVEMFDTQQEMFL